ncbi:Benzyl alcohol O-benzoyltransferase [Zea mays]|uniref:Benzyl alcohol O-benzoyltransferase n=1 Tax=Zea mays TaxID=4577 RepID=A0A3L6DEX2_MAIZE|nr:Benzyl alcohol O-benzoyltransferase [Zea mays]
MATINFTVHRRPAVLVAPASPTPRELKRLSDFDDQESLRFRIPVIHFYKSKESMAMGCSGDPAVVIRDAVARALVPYYPFAGRLREHDGGKLAVDCTGEGVLFVEADADVCLEQFGDVTRLACGGFVLALRLNHTMADALGLTQFLGAVAELARGVAQAPTVRPVWERHLLEGQRNPPPRIISDGLELWYEAEMADDDGDNIIPSSLNLKDDDMALRSFFFGPGEIAAIRDQLSPDLQKRASRFDVIAGWLWKHRTMALAPDYSADEPMLILVVVNARGRDREATGCAGIPTGYYGNAFAIPVAVSTAGELCANPVSYAVGLVKEAKDKVDMEYMRSAANLIVLRGRRSPRFTVGMYSLTDETKARFHDLDFGWGRPVYGGPAEAVGTPALPWLSSFILPFKNASGEDGAVVPVCLPRLAMDRLVDEMGKLRRRSPADVQQPRHGFPAIVKRSAL